MMRLIDARNTTFVMPCAEELAERREEVPKTPQGERELAHWHKVIVFPYPNLHSFVGSIVGCRSARMPPLSSLRRSASAQTLCCNPEIGHLAKPCHRLVPEINRPGILMSSIVSMLAPESNSVGV